MDILDQIESVEDVATRLNVSTRRVRVWCEEQRLVSRKIGREWVIAKGQPRPAEKKPTIPAIKLNGIKKAVGTFNAWQGHARIAFDKADLTVWTETLVNENDKVTYHADTIIEVAVKRMMQDRDNTITMKELQQLCEAALNGEETKWF